MVTADEVVAGKYRIDRVLGKGAMGEVVGAWHLKLQKPVAIKLMLPDALGNREGVERFMREARAAAQLKSQHAVKIFDVDTHASGAPYIVMEHLDGTDLRELQRQQGALPPGEAVSYILQACEAIAEAHQNGIVHRDLKPANLFVASGVGGRPCVKVLDFGIAKVVDTAAPAPATSDLTHTYAILGTPLFMSPEQTMCTRDVDGRSDIWSLGVILYKLVTDHVPFNGDDIHDLIHQVRSKPAPSPLDWKHDLPPELARIILRCLEKDPAKRYQSVAELAEALEPFATATNPLSFPQAPVASTAGAVGGSTREEPSPQATRTIPQPPPAARIAVDEPLDAQTGAPTSRTQSGLSAAPPRSRRFVLAGSATGLAVLLATGLLLWPSREEALHKPAAESGPETAPTASLQPPPSQSAAPPVEAPPSVPVEPPVMPKVKPGPPAMGPPGVKTGEAPAGPGVPKAAKPRDRGSPAPAESAPPVQTAPPTTVPAPPSMQPSAATKTPIPEPSKELPTDRNKW